MKILMQGLKITMYAVLLEAFSDRVLVAFFTVLSTLEIELKT